MLLKHYSQLPRHGNNLNAHQWMNGLGRCGTYIQWNTTQPQKRMNKKEKTKNKKEKRIAATWMELETFILSQKEKNRHHMISLTCGV